MTLSSAFRYTLAPALAGLALTAPLISQGAPAQEYRSLETGQSELAFTYRQMGVEMNGRFRQLSGTVSFNPAKPELAKAVVEVPLASIDAGSSDANGEVAGKAWFDVSHFPSARFELGKVLAQGGDRYQISGRLSIKGRSKEVSSVATLKRQGALGVMEGEFDFNRSDFAVGEGSWADTSIVANPIHIRYRLTLR